MGVVEQRIGQHRLFLGDCMDVMPTLGPVDAVVTDPPYGINAARQRNSQKWGWTDYVGGEWDRDRAPPDTIRAIVAAAKDVIVWGGNYFTDALPPSERWLVWDKCQEDFSLADCELAWCSAKGAVRRLNYPRAKALQDGKQHPTQKPVALMEWCLGFLPNARTILDPFAGSGTTGVACQRLGRTFIGIEKDPDYFAIMCKRIDEAMRQPDLFVSAPPRPEQAGFDI
jgi:DNA modification methylase